MNRRCFLPSVPIGSHIGSRFPLVTNGSDGSPPKGDRQPGTSPHAVPHRFPWTGKAP
jgi:hypothetical protein